MKVIEVKSNKEKKEYIKFIYKLYENDKNYLDLNLVFVKTFLYKKDSYAKRSNVNPIIIEDNGEIKLVATFIYTDDSKELKLSFLEFKQNAKIYLEEAINYGKKILDEKNLDKMVVGINGQISYGLGILTPEYNNEFEFNANYNLPYYTKELDEVFDIKKNAISYLYEAEYALSLIDKNIVNKLNETYQFRYMDKKNFKKDMIIFGELCDKTLCTTPYYSKKNTHEMYELMNSMKIFMKNEDIIFAMKDGKEIGFIYTHPDYCELMEGPKINYIKFFFKNIFNKPKKIIYNVIGVLPEYQRSGVALALVYNSINLRKDKYEYSVSSFILEENVASTELCSKISSGINKKYRIYELNKEQKGV